MRQSEALAILNAGANVFLTGAPGAGKTYVLNEFIRQARADGANVAVTASTGIAATHIDGQTIHSWSGVGLANVLTPNLLKTIKTRRRRKIQAADVLIIDEVSMMHAWLFDMVDQVCREVRHDPRPFGGLQVVLSGDFFQLPPVSVSGRDRDVLPPGPDFVASRERYAKAGLNPEGFVTESLVWGELAPVICYLTEQHRQDDGRLLHVLTDIRAGCVDQDDRDALVTRLGVTPQPGEVAVHLFPVNRQADNLNDSRLARIDKEPHEFHAKQMGPAHLVERLKERRPTESTASWAFRYAGSWPGVLTVLSGMTYMEHLQDNIRTYSPLEPCTGKELATGKLVAHKDAPICKRSRAGRRNRGCSANHAKENEPKGSALRLVSA